MSFYGRKIFKQNTLQNINVELKKAACNICMLYLHITIEAWFDREVLSCYCFLNIAKRIQQNVFIVQGIQKTIKLRHRKVKSLYNMVQRRSYLSLESNILRPINLTRYTTLKAPIKFLGFILSHIKIYTYAPYFCWQEMQNQKRGFFNLIILF